MSSMIAPMLASSEAESPKTETSESQASSPGESGGVWWCGTGASGGKADLTSVSVLKVRHVLEILPSSFMSRLCLLRANILNPSVLKELTRVCACPPKLPFFLAFF